MAQGTSLTTSLPTAISSAYLALACLLFGATLAVYRNPWVKDHTQGTAVTRDTAVTTPDFYPLIYQGILLSCVYVCFFFFSLSVTSMAGGSSQARDQIQTGAAMRPMPQLQQRQILKLLCHSRTPSPFMCFSGCLDVCSSFRS